MSVAVLEDNIFVLLRDKTQSAISYKQREGIFCLPKGELRDTVGGEGRATEIQVVSEQFETQKYCSLIITSVHLFSN